MKKASNFLSNRGATRFRKSAMAHACVLVVAATAASGAFAQTATYSYAFGTAPVLLPSYVSPQSMTLSTYINNMLNDQVNFLVPVSAGVTSSGVLASVAAGATPITVSGSSITSTARANGSVLAPFAATNTINLGSVTIPGSTGQGALILSGQIAGGDLATSASTVSSVSAGNVTITATGTSPADLVLKNSTIAADTAVNAVANTMSGTLPAGYSSAQVGSVDAAFNGNVLPPTTNATVTGGLQITSVQTALNEGQRAGSGATVTNSNVTLNVNAMAVTESASLTVNSNEVRADFAANRASSSFAADGTDNFTGSVTNTSLQTNLETVGGGNLPTASVSGSSITADYRNEVANNSTSLSGALTLSKNTVGASSTGNSASTFSSFSTDANITGTGSLVGNTLSVPNNQMIASVQSDMVVLSGQGNANTGLVTTVTGGVVRARGDDLEAGGTVTVKNNAVSADSTGNTAANGFSATAGTVSATVAVANIQANDATTITATNTSPIVAAEIGIQGGTVSGAIVVNKNTLSATATGSASNSGVVLSTATIDNALAGPSSVAATYPGGFGAVDSTASISVNNMQGNHGSALISAALTNGSVSADAEDTFLPPANAEVQISNATITLGRNEIRAAATGNSAVSGALLDGPTMSTSAAVGNTQYNNNTIQGTVSGVTGVTSLVRGVTDSTITIDKNTVASSATGNFVNNILVVGTTDPLTGDVNEVSSLTAGPATFAGATASSNANNPAGVAVTTAAFAIASGQVNEGNVVTSNITDGAFAEIEAGRGTGITGGTLTVSSNVASADGVGNQSQNDLALNATNLASATGVASQIAGITNFQENDTAGASSATVGGNGGRLVGIRFRDSLNGAGNALTVSKNDIRATIAGNSTDNTLAVTASDYTSTPAATATGSAAADNAGAASVTNEFALVNNQTDSALSRTATAQQAVISIDDSGAAITGVQATLTVTGNRVDADARNNKATNNLSLTGFTNLTSGAGLVSQQTSDTPVGATVTDARIRIRAGSGATTVADSTMTLSRNTVQALAVGNVGLNTMEVDATNLTGNANIATGSNSFTPLGLAVTADYGVGNVQNQSGAVTSSADASARINLNGSTVSDSVLTLNRNAVNAISVSNSAGNELALTGTNVTASAGVGSVQNASGAVSATQTTPPAELATFVVMNDNAVNGMVDTTSVVSRNTVLASAGQNEADNRLAVEGTLVTGRGLGNNVSSYVAGTGVASSGADFSVVNVQNGTAGAVTASATPGLIGADVLLTRGGNITIGKNTVTANANVNSSSNALVFGVVDLTAVLSATGGVVNAQTTAQQAVSATIGVPAGGTVTQVGVTSTAGSPVALNGTTTTISDNALKASATGNNTSNTLDASSTAVVNLSGAGQTFAILNYQSSAATLNALVQNAAIGINVSGLGASGGLTTFAGSVGVVSGNSVAAIGGGNTANNAMTATSGATVNGGTNTSEFALNSTQLNTGAVTSRASDIAIGLNAGGVGGSVTSSPVTIGSNSVLASGYGNTASNSIALSAVSSSTASAGLTNSQLNTASISSSVNGTTIGLTAATAGGTSPITITNNSIASVAVGNSANNSITQK